MIIDGKKIAENLQAELKELIQKLIPQKPGLAFILVGHHAPSHTYVRMKKKGCLEVGIHSETYELEATISEKDLIALIKKCNENPNIHGILVQQPLPAHLSEQKVLEAIDPRKDVDGFHPLNIGKALLGQEDGFLSCTPLGIVTLLEKAQVQIEGKHVVILGRSNIVGKPLAALLMQKKPQRNATVTVAHSQTTDLPNLCKTADILIAAIGQPLFVKKSFVKKGASVIDVGINILEKDGKKIIVGDVAFEEVEPLCSHITPVPKGVGPMTITMLLYNTYLSCLRHHFQKL